jgi:hypothetical protein
MSEKWMRKKRRRCTGRVLEAMGQEGEEEASLLPGGERFGSKRKHGRRGIRKRWWAAPRVGSDGGGIRRQERRPGLGSGWRLQLGFLAAMAVLQGRVHAPDPDDDADGIAISLRRWHGVHDFSFA